MRIFRKMCTSLARAGYRTVLIVADGLGDAEISGVSILDVGRSRSRLRRLLLAPLRLRAAALRVGADLFHLHDPELLPLGVALKRRGHRVVFDSHEDVPSQILHKPYLPSLIAPSLSLVYSVYEAYASRQLDGVVAATPFIREKFRRFARRVVDVSNFPIRDEFGTLPESEEPRNGVCYVGDLSLIRGVRELCAAMTLVRSEALLRICGAFSDAAAKQTAMAHSGWNRVQFHGVVDRAGIRSVFSRSVAGLVTLHPVPNYVNSQPIKMFEYMSAGLPVIASDFPLFREIVSGNDCGILVDPMSAQSIADAIDFLVDHPVEAARLGRNGRAAVLARYNWEHEESALFKFYREILDAGPA